MRFCKYLVQDLNFEPHGLQPCCNIRNLAIPTFPFHGERLPLRAYNEHIARVLKGLQRQPPEYCAHCPDLMGDVDFVGKIEDVRCKFHTISFNQHRYICNCRCVYCDLWKTKSPRKPYSILPVLKSLHAQGALHTRCFMSWGGGEPTLLSDFETTSQWIHKKGYLQNIHTNALRHSLWIDTLLSSGKGCVNVSLDSGDAHAYRTIKGVDGLDKVIKTLERYFSAAQHASLMHLKYIIFEATNSRESIDAFFRLCSRLGAKCVLYSFDFREVNANMASSKSIEAAAYFRQLAGALGMACMPFFVNEAMAARIDEAAARAVSR